MIHHKHMGKNLGLRDRALEIFLQGRMSQPLFFSLGYGAIDPNEAVPGVRDNL